MVTAARSIVTPQDSTSTRLNIVRESLIRNQTVNVLDQNMDTYNSYRDKRTVSHNDDDHHEIRSKATGSGPHSSSSSVIVKPWEGETILQEEVCLMGEEGLELTLGNSNTCCKVSMDMNTTATDLVSMSRTSSAAVAMSID